MSDADTFVAIGDTFGASDSATYFEVRDPALIDREQGGEFDDGGLDEFIAGASLAVDVDDLVRVAVTAVAVLDSDCGVKSLSELAAAVKAAGLGDFTDTFPAIEDGSNGQ